MPRSHWFLSINLIGSCNKHPNIQSHKDTYAHTTDIWAIFSNFCRNSRTCWIEYKIEIDQTWRFSVSKPKKCTISHISAACQIELTSLRMIKVDYFHSYNLKTLWYMSHFCCMPNMVPVKEWSKRDRICRSQEFATSCRLEFLTIKFQTFCIIWAI